MFNGGRNSGHVLPGTAAEVSWAGLPDRRPAAGGRGLGRVLVWVIHREPRRPIRCSEAGRSTGYAVNGLLRSRRLAIADFGARAIRTGTVWSRLVAPSRASFGLILLIWSLTEKGPRALRRAGFGAVVYSGALRPWPSASSPSCGWCLRWQIPKSKIPKPMDIAPRPPQGSVGMGIWDFGFAPDRREGRVRCPSPCQKCGFEGSERRESGRGRIRSLRVHDAMKGQGKRARQAAVPITPVESDAATSWAAARARGSGVGAGRPATVACLCPTARHRFKRSGAQTPARGLRPGLSEGTDLMPNGDSKPVGRLRLTMESISASGTAPRRNPFQSRRPSSLRQGIGTRGCW